MMSYSIFISHTFTADVSGIVQMLGQTGQATCQSLCVLYSHKIVDEVGVVKWLPLEQLTAGTNVPIEHSESCIVDNLKTTSEVLHIAADSLPASGIIVDVYLWPPDNPHQSDYILFLGALRRLKDWHNARVVIFDPDPTPDIEFLQKFLSADIHVHSDSFHVTGNDEMLWRGKVSICDKIENQGLTIPGISLHRLSDDTTDLQYPFLHKTRNPTQGTCFLGRMFEVLDEVSLCTVPSVLKTAHVYKLCLYQKHPYSQVLMNYVQQNTQTGMLARLSVYPSDKAPPSCGEIGLSTEAWKENLIADIQYVQEPEEDLQDNFEFLYFIITFLDKHRTPENFVAQAHLLQHPYHLNGAMVTSMYHQAICPVRGGNCSEVDLSSLPCLSWDTVRNVKEDMAVLQRTMLQRLIDNKQARHESTEFDRQELVSYLSEVTLKYVAMLKDKLHACKTMQPNMRLRLKKEVYEAMENSYEWPERLIQQYMESQKRSLSRIQSTESMPMSSPIQPCEASTNIDIDSFLKFFLPDGSATATNLSPVRRRHPGRTKSKLCTPDTTSPHLPSWPESKDVPAHDVYYNVDKRTEKLNAHLNKIQEKYVKEETYSSCLSQVVLFPRATKKRPISEDVELRRSPRKKNPRSMFDENKPATGLKTKSNRGRLSDSQTPLATIPEKGSRRRFSTPHGLPPHRAGSSSSQDYTLWSRLLSNLGKLTISITPTMSKCGVVNFNFYGGKSDFDRQCRRSDAGTSRTPVPRQVDKLRRESDGDSSFVTPQGQSVQKESRSERHKRRLHDIVDGVLADKGVTNTDPIYKSCSTRLFKVTKLFVMDLPNSRHLKNEMKKIAESQVHQVIEVDRKRHNTTQRGKHKHSNMN